MNIEFLIHGTLSGGQSSWKETDTDYCQLFYTKQKQDVVMKVEVVNRPHGLCSYYNYLRYNNISAPSRTGSYFGMTVRVDGLLCTDVKGMYDMLDRLFHQVVVGSLLRQTDNGYVYTFSDFKEKQQQLQALETQFVGLFKVMFLSGNFFVSIPSSYKKGSSAFYVNTNDIRANIANELANGNVLYLSPEFDSAAVKNIRNDAQQNIAKIKSQLQAAQESNQKYELELQQLKTEVNRLTGEVIRLGNDLQQQIGASSTSQKTWRKERDALNNKLDYVQAELKKAHAELEKKERECAELKKDRLDDKVIAGMSGVIEPLKQWSEHMGKRISPQRGERMSADKGKKEKKGCKWLNKLRGWLPFLNCLLLLVILLILSMGHKGVSSVAKSTPVMIDNTVETVTPQEPKQKGEAKEGILSQPPSSDTADKKGGKAIQSTSHQFYQTNDPTKQ